jgi:hypothetical protein
LPLVNFSFTLLTCVTGATPGRWETMREKLE